MIQRIDTQGAYAKAVVANGMVFLSGLMAKDRTGDISRQTRDVLSQIDHHLKSAGSDKQHLVSVNIWLSNLDNFSAMNSVWNEWLDAEHKPVRATVESRLVGENGLIEIMAQAVLP